MTEEVKREAAHVSVRGVVQGVGFRPFIYQLAVRCDLTGWVCNTSEDVKITIEGSADSIRTFIDAIPTDAPPRASIEDITVSDITFEGYTDFTIRESIAEQDRYQLVSPDIATCQDCLKEILDPADRRYHYPFTNCTNCGPRFTIIEDIPYDRPLTTMKNFVMCPECEREYNDPANRRFHAQPNACPVCGPSLTLTDANGTELPTEDIIAKAAQLLRDGNILAIKGLGGFLVACDATSETAVKALRERKHRPGKPFAVMVSGIEEARLHCALTTAEEELLSSPGAPIVLTTWKPDSTVCRPVAPATDRLGIMLPYTPLHHLLIRAAGIPLVMTSGNLSEEPIAKDNDEALQRLSGIADYFILHNRDIYSRYDDSVMIAEDEQPITVRRARGYAPYPVKITPSDDMILACGAELKNTFCLTRDQYAFVSQHIGDMENLETFDHYRNTLDLYKKLFRIEPKVIAHDLHPDYMATRYALELAETDPNLTLIPVQHHHAHIASCMADNRLDRQVIGVALDGTGFGTDGAIWGGEFMTCDYQGFTRFAHFEYLPLAGGDLATRKPYRIAAGYLYKLLGEDKLREVLPFIGRPDEEELRIIMQQIDKGINTPVTSSCGRLFDAVSALLGVCTEISYEAQAAIELESLAATAEDDGYHYPFSLRREGDGLVIPVAGTFESVIADLQAGVEKATIASRFHTTIAELSTYLCQLISDVTRIKDVALSGGVFQNRLLLQRTSRSLQEAGFTVHTHRQVPTNDGGISLGQAVIAARISREK